MRKFIYYLIPVIVLGLFAFIMSSGEYLKKARGVEDDFVKCLEMVRSNINSAQWDVASINADKLENAWRNVCRRIQFSAERDEMNQMNVNLSRLKGAISARNRANALMELNEAGMHWESIGK